MHAPKIYRAEHTVNPVNKMNYYMSNGTLNSTNSHKKQKNYEKQ